MKILGFIYKKQLSQIVKMYKGHIKLKRKVWKVGKTGQRLITIPKSCENIKAGDYVLIVKKMVGGSKK